MAELLADKPQSTNSDQALVLSRSDRVKRIVVATGLIVLPAATGAEIGVGLTLNDQHNNKVSDSKTAAGLERCLDFTKALGAGKVTLRAGEISREMQVDCQVADAIDKETAAVRNATTESTRLGGTSVTATTDTIVTFDEATLQQSIKTLHDSEGLTDVSELITTGFIGAATGFILALAADVARIYRNRPRHTNPGRAIYDGAQALTTEAEQGKLDRLSL